MPPLPNHYATLEVLQTATDAEIKKEYRRLILKHHPDKNLGDNNAAEAFRKVQEAYDVLKDAMSRKTYDRECKRNGVQAPNVTVPKSEPRKTRSTTEKDREEERERLRKLAAERVREAQEKLRKEARERKQAEEEDTEGEDTEEEDTEEDSEGEDSEGEDSEEEAERESAEKERERKKERKRWEKKREEELREKWERERKEEQKEAKKKEARRKQREEELKKQWEREREEEEREAELKKAKRKQREEKEKRKAAEKRQEELEENIRRLTQQFETFMQSNSEYGSPKQRETRQSYSPVPVRGGGSRWLAEEEDFLLELRSEGLDWMEVSQDLNDKFQRWRTPGACSSKFYRLRQERNIAW